MAAISGEMVMIICGDEFMARQYIPKGGTMIDVGSCYGMWIEFMLKQADRVFSFEPDKRLFPELVKKYRDNPKVVLSNTALSSVCGIEGFRLNAEGNSRLEGNETDNFVITVPLDSLFENIPITCIKIDVEGREMLVLNGGMKIILKYQPVMIVEAHDNRQQIKDFFDTCRYKIIFTHIRSRFPMTDNGLMVAVPENYKAEETKIEVPITMERYRGKTALSLLESIVDKK